MYASINNLENELYIKTGFLTNPYHYFCYLALFIQPAVYLLKTGSNNVILVNPGLTTAYPAHANDIMIVIVIANQ